MKCTNCRCSAKGLSETDKCVCGKHSNGQDMQTCGSDNAGKGYKHKIDNLDIGTMLFGVNSILFVFIIVACVTIIIMLINYMTDNALFEWLQNIAKELFVKKYLQ